MSKMRTCAPSFGAVCEKLSGSPLPSSGQPRHRTYLFCSNLILATNGVCHIIDCAICAAVHDVGIAFGRGDAAVAGGFFHGGHIFTYVGAHADKRVAQVVYSHVGQFGVL